MPLERHELRLLAEIGFIAAWRGDAPQALTIFRALEAARPETPGGYVGQAMAHMCAGQFGDALPVLDRGLRIVPATDHSELHAFRGLALQLAGRSSESLRALRQAGDLPMAKALLGEPAATKEG